MDLQRFCATEFDPRMHLRAPWLHDGWVYASNGHVCVRVPAASRPDVTATPEKAPAAHQLFERWLVGREAEMKVLPDLPEITACRACEGRGWFHVRICPSCEGEGTFLRHNEEYDCKLCAEEPCGQGWLVTEESESTKRESCIHCWGRGAAPEAFELFGVGFELVYLHWLKALGQTRVHVDPVHCDPMNTKPAPGVFLFDGGQGLVMPRRL